MWFSVLLMTLLMFSGLFLIGLILLQRGRGGGLAGAFGGMGGQSAFGTKAGDVFTRITIGVASVWILLCAGGVISLRYASSGLRTNDDMFKKADAAEVKKAKPADEKAPGEEALPEAGSALKAAPDDKPAGAPADKPGDAKLDEAKPDAKPEEKAAEPAPATPEPNKDKPADEKPKEEKPAEGKPADEKPAEPPK